MAQPTYSTSPFSCTQGRACRSSTSTLAGDAHTSGIDPSSGGDKADPKPALQPNPSPPFSHLHRSFAPSASRRRCRRRAPLDPAATGTPEQRDLDYEVRRPLLLPPGPPAGAGKLSSAGSPRSTTVGIAAAAASTCNTGAPRPLQACPDLTVSRRSYPLSPHA